MVIDGEIRGTGDSRKIKSNDKLPPTYAEFRQMFIDIGIDIDLFINEIGWNILGSKLNKAFFLSDPTAAKYGLTGENATVNNALAAAATEVGDTLTTLRTSPGPQWALANGAIVDGSQYPEIAPLLSPRYMSPTQAWGVHPSSTTNNKVNAGSRRTAVKQAGVAVLMSTNSGWKYTANAFAESITWVDCVFPTANGFNAENIIYANGMWACAATTMSGQSGTLTVWYCTGAPTTAAAWTQAYQVGFSAGRPNNGFAYMGGIAFNGINWGVAIGVHSTEVNASYLSRRMFFAQTSGASITTGWSTSYGQEYYGLISYWPQVLETTNSLVGANGYFWYMGSAQDAANHTTWRSTTFPTLTAGPIFSSSYVRSTTSWFITGTGEVFAYPESITLQLYLGSIAAAGVGVISWSSTEYVGVPIYTGVRWIMTRFTGSPAVLTPRLTPGIFTSLSQLRGEATITSSTSYNNFYPIAALENPANPGKILLFMYMANVGLQWIYTMNINDLTLPTISIPGAYTYVRIKP